MSLSLRTCIVCHRVLLQKELLRIARFKDGHLGVDAKKGRGVYLCSQTKCLERFIKHPPLRQHFLGTRDLPEPLLHSLKKHVTQATEETSEGTKAPD